MTQWHYSLNGQQLGPVTADEIKQLLASGVLNNNTLVWKEGLEDWVPLAVAMPETQPGAPVRTQVPTTPRGAEPVVTTQAPYATSQAAPSYASTPAYPSAQPSFNQPEQTHPFEFRGAAGEYFRIWIVNVVLTLLTLGIYAAWAKVRTRRYFYGNTLLDGKPFDFTGNPIAILKGNLIFGGLFIVYIISGTIFPPLALLIALLIFAIAPLLITKALRFRAHNTVHRNVRFNFRGTAGEAYGVYMGLALLIPFTLGFISPYMGFRQKQFFLGNMGWGNTAASMRGSAGFFYKTFFKVFAIFLLPALAILGGLAVPAYNGVQKKARQMQEMRTQQQQQGQTTPSPAPSPTNTQDDSDTRLHRPTGRQGLPGPAESGMIFGIFGFYALAFGAGIFYKVRTSNYSINATEWGRLGRLHSSVRVRDLIWLFFTNGLAVLFSLGLAIPWVKIRMARYVTAHTHFIASGSLDSVAQSYSAAESAMGDAGTDIFDVEIGF